MRSNSYDSNMPLFLSSFLSLSLYVCVSVSPSFSFNLSLSFCLFSNLSFSLLSSSSVYLH